MAYVATIRNPTAYRAITGRHQAGKAPTLDDVMLDVEASQEQGDGDGSTSAVDQEYADIDAEGLWDDVDRVGAIDSTKFDEHAARGDFHYSDGHSSDDGGVCSTAEEMVARRERTASSGCVRSSKRAGRTRRRTHLRR